jgi:hypothetical protein
LPRLSVSSPKQARSAAHGASGGLEMPCAHRSGRPRSVRNAHRSRGHAAVTCNPRALGR